MIPFNPSPKKAHELDQYVEEGDGGREMAEDFGGAVRSGESCWIISDRDTCFDSPSSMSRSSPESASVTCHETYKLIHRSNSIMPSFILPSSSPSMNWTQASLRGGRSESSFHSMLRRDAGLRPYTKQDSLGDSDPAPAVGESSTAHPFSNMEHSFSLDQDSLLEFSDGGFGRSFNQSVCDNIRVMNCNQHFPMLAHQGSPDWLWQQPSWAKFSQLRRTSSLPKQEPNNQLPFGNSPSFWTASHAAASAGDDVCSTNIAARKTGSVAGIKRPRIETPSPLPSFKVRKEKLGDRITALQQLVSPFGKTDTASVLQEAIECIKFLHDQVAALSSPYLNSNRHAMQQKQMQQISDISTDCSEEKNDLRSRGLCLVPVTSTYPVASATTPDYLWHPTFGGTSSVN